MLNPMSLEMMTDGIQADRQKAAEMARLAKACQSSKLSLRERVGNFISFSGRKVKGQLQGKPGVQQAQGHIEIHVD